MARYELTSKPHHVVLTHAVVGHQLHQLRHGEQPPPYCKPWRFQKAISNTYIGAKCLWCRCQCCHKPCMPFWENWFWCQEVHQWILDRYATTPDPKGGMYPCGMYPCGMYPSHPS